MFEIGSQMFGSGIGCDRFGRGGRLPAALVWALVVGLCCAASTGCQKADSNGSKLNVANFREIRVGMHHDELVDIFGEPTHRVGPSANGSFDWTWVDGPRKITVAVQLDGTVMGVGSRAAKRGTNLR